MPKISFKKAKRRHNRRPAKSRKADESRTSKKKSIEITKSWMKDPTRSDIVGIDTKKLKAKNIMEVNRFLSTVYRKPKKVLLEKTDFIVKEDKRRSIVTIRPRGHKKTTESNIRNLLEMRFNNVTVRSRKTKKPNDDFWLSIRK